MRVSISKRRRRRGIAVVLDYRDATGRRCQPVLGYATSEDSIAPIMEDAKREAARIELELIEGRHTPKVGDKPIDAALVEFNEFMQPANRKPHTKRTYREAIKKFREFLRETRARRLRDVTPELLVQFIGWQQSGKKPKAANSIIRDLTCLQWIFRRCVERGDMLRNPCTHPDVRDVRPNSVKHERAFTAEQVDTFLSACETRNKSPQKGDYAEFFLLLAETGLRLSEGRMLRLCDIHLGYDGQDYLRVEPHDGWSPKTKTSIRRVPLPPRVSGMLRARIKRLERFDPSAKVFPNTWTNRSVDQCFLRVLRRCDLSAPDDRHGQTLTVHSLRHYYATRLVRGGADPATVRDLLGHSSITTTNRYFNVPRAELFATVLGTFASASPNSSPSATVSIGLQRRKVRIDHNSHDGRLAQNP